MCQGMTMLSLKTIQEHVSMLFYHHGLLCASHPFAIISVVITIVMFMWSVSTSRLSVCSLVLTVVSSMSFVRTFN